MSGQEHRIKMNGGTDVSHRTLVASVVTAKVTPFIVITVS